jgi:hypothetical protein
MPPTSSVAKPKIAGIGHDSPSGVSGIAPNAAPSAAPTTTEPTTNDRAFSYSRSANCSMIVGS